jgi:hypothetical protein
MFTPESAPNLQLLKKLTVSSTSAGEHLPYSPNLSVHIDSLCHEFSGRTQLELFHAATIVFIRRGQNTEHCVANFEHMWQEEFDFFLGRLDLRWLISACDTIVDHVDSAEDVAFATAAILFGNVIKLYETEELICGLKGSLSTRPRGAPPIELFDGLKAFNVGSGDMVRNMISRVDRLNSSSLGLRILREIVERMLRSDTIFQRFAEIHFHEATRWRAGA